MTARRHRGVPRHRWPVVLAGLVAVALLALPGSLVPTTGGALTGRVTNSTNTVASGIYAATATCVSAARDIGSAFFVHPLDEASGTVANDSSTAARPGTYRNTGNISYRAAGPCPRDGARAVTLRGSDGAAGYVTSNTQVANPQTFSAAVWFRTSTTAGGKLIGFGNAASGQSGQYDRHIYMTTTGTLIAGVFDGATRTVQSAAAYNDNAWHHAVITLAQSGNANPGLRLYVDGALVGSLPGSTVAESYSGYWRMGYDNLSSWPSTPTRQSFAGSLAFGEVFTSALTPAQVSSLDAAGR